MTKRRIRTAVIMLTIILSRIKLKKSEIDELIRCLKYKDLSLRLECTKKKDFTDYIK